MGKQVRTNSEFEVLMRQNVRLARRSEMGGFRALAIERLRGLTKEFGFSLALGDLQYLDRGWYVTHSGLLRLAQRRRCAGIRVQQVQRFCDPVISRWVFKATVFDRSSSRGFVGYGDADPSNVSTLVQGAELRVAETRAVNRALRKAYGIGLCSVEELGWAPRVADSKPSGPSGSSSVTNNGNRNGHSNGQPRLRDRLCLLIRQHGLDASLVKAYAASYCGTASLRDANREQVETFIDHLANRAANERDGLICQLNSYSSVQEPTK